MFIKLPKKITQEEPSRKKLVNVCAWCPKEEYPKLLPDEDYTHGLCEKHYQMLKEKQSIR